MLLCDEDWTEWWVECDFCGNKTKKYNSEEIAEFKWNEFQYKRFIPKADQFCLCDDHGACAYCIERESYPPGWDEPIIS